VGAVVARLAWGRPGPALPAGALAANGRGVIQARAMSQVHPTAVLEGEVAIGPGSEIGALCYLRGPLVIGANTKIYPHCVIGTEGEHRSRGPVGVIRIGDDTILRELVVVQRGTGDQETSIGDRCYIMDHGHVGHDVVIDDAVTLSPNVTLGGHTHVHRGATIGIGAMTHQFSTVGAYAMIGMGSVVTKDVSPFTLVSGNPARYRRFNTHAFAAAGVVAAELEIVDGVLVATGAAKAHLDKFRAEVRRTPMPLRLAAE
jgi:UDP-N-acetylglucosamine acyltransferase